MKEPAGFHFVGSPLAERHHPRSAASARVLHTSSKGFTEMGSGCSGCDRAAHTGRHFIGSGRMVTGWTVSSQWFSVLKYIFQWQRRFLARYTADLGRGAFVNGRGNLPNRTHSLNATERIDYFTRVPDLPLP